VRSVRLRRLPAVVLAAALLLPACGGGDAGEVASEPAPSPAANEDLAMKPDFDIDTDQEPPTGLQIDDLVEGEGDTAEAGDQVSVHYVGKAWSTGEEFDASWNSGQPFTFQVGGGQVIQGWDEGVEGMKVGGRRKLVIPPEKGYGAQGAGGVIGPNETLVFVVDLLEVH
jgi:peptidylprolyl isomerase